MKRDIGKGALSNDSQASARMASDVKFPSMLCLAAQLWMTAVLFIFLAIRVLSSHTVQDLLHRVELP